MFGWFRRAREAGSSPSLDFVHRREGFRDILEVERMRSDRTGSPFALAVFSLPPTVDESALPSLAHHVERRRRATDHVGRMHDRHLGVVLWNTDEAGAWAFADNVLDAWQKRTVDGVSGVADPVEPEIEVFVYPTHRPPEGGDPPGRRPEAAEPRESQSKTTTPAEPAARAETRSLETLFVRPLPFWKRFFDVVGAGFGLVVLGPLLLVVATLVKWTSPGPVLFLQRRTGHGGREFTILKFRTMVADAEAKKAALRAKSEQDGPAFKLANDPRITPIGRFLRKTCIDELPQLWNVLVGDMTLVGPRPLDVKEADLTSGWERRRLDVTPGLTCIWQVDGKSRVTFAEWMRMDIRYARVGSFWADARLVVRTLLAMLRLKASQ